MSFRYACLLIVFSFFVNVSADGTPIVFPIRQPRGPDPTQNFAFRPSRLHASSIAFGVVDDSDAASDYSEHRRSGLFDVHAPTFQSIVS